MIEKNDKYTQQNKEDLVDIMLDMIGEDPNRPGLQDTPKRVVKMWNEIFGGYTNKPPKVTTFDNGTDNISNDDMNSDTGSFHSYCEHHMIPFIGNYYFAYIPHPKGKILGLSKVARVVDHFSAKLQIQERLVQEILDYIWKEITVDGKEPLGMALVMDAEHLCKTMRGVKKKGKMRSTRLRGAHSENPHTRAEFMSWVNSNV